MSDTTLTKIERMKAERDKLIARRNAYVRNMRLDMAVKMDARIDELDKVLDDLKPKPLSQIAPMEDLRKLKVLEHLVQVYMAADFLADRCFQVNEDFDRLGLELHNIAPEAKDLCRRAEQFASRVAAPEFAGLADFILENEAYIEGMRELTEDYQKRRLKIVEEIKP